MENKLLVFNVDCSEVNKQLVCQKRWLEAELKNEVSKRQKIEAEVKYLRTELGTAGKSKRHRSASKS